jgi:signal transduction histidine kinase/ActR/RegA family two-component response regulator
MDCSHPTATVADCESEDSQSTSQSASAEWGQYSLSRLPDCLEEGLLLLTLTGVVQEINPAALTLLDRPRASLLGEPLGKFLPEFAQFDWRRLVSGLTVTGRADAVPFHLERSYVRDGAIRIDTRWEARFFLSESPHDQRLAVLLVPRDTSKASDLAIRAYAAELQTVIADRARKEQALTQQALALAEAREQLARQFLLSTHFLANLGQEYRMPLTSLLGYVDLLSQEEPPLGDNPWLQVVRRNAEYLLCKVDDLLQYSEIERGEARVHVETIGLSPAILDVVNLFTRHAAHKGLSIEVSFLGPVPESIQTDPARLRQILLQLLGNAVKHTERGLIQVVVELATPAHAKQPQIRIAISDTGVGIAPDLRQHLFDPLHWEANSPHQTSIGTRLGLAIAHRTALLLGGDLTCDSEIGQGSTFTLTIATGSLEAVRLRWVQPLLEPVSPERAATPPSGIATPPATQDVDLSQTRILVVEDSIDNQRLIRMILNRAGAAVVVAENGQVACDLVAAGTDVNAFDLILMDIQIPEMDGYEATRRLRQLGCTRPIIALTAHTLSSDRENCLAAGCDDYLAKPVNRKRLLQTLSRWRATIGHLAEAH